MPRLAKASAMESSPTITKAGRSVFKETKLPFKTEVGDRERSVKAGHATKGAEVGVEVGITNAIDQAGTNIKTTTGDARDHGRKKGRADDAQGRGTGPVVVRMNNTGGIAVVLPTTMTAADQGMNTASVDDRIFT